MNISEIGKQKIIFSSTDNAIDVEKYYIKNEYNITSEKIENILVSRH